MWETVLDVIRPAIEEQGYYHYPRSFREFRQEHNIEAPRPTPSYLSLDFWSGQRELSENNFYVIRLGLGSFVIFSIDEFPRPYLALDTAHVQDLELPHKSSFPRLQTSFKRLDYKLKSAENTLLELARYHDLYSRLTNIFEPSLAYQIGPRGGMTQRFDVYMRRTNGTLQKFPYNGQVELDYTVWNKQRVFVFEAKSLVREGRGFDIGWHKLAFPAQRFASQSISDGLQVNPVYFLRTKEANEQVILLYVFKDLKFHNNGIILNESDHWEPVCTLRINLSPLLK